MNLPNNTTNGGTRGYSDFFTLGFRLVSRGGNRRFATTKIQTQRSRNQGDNGNESDLNKGSTPISSLTFDSMSSLDLTSGSKTGHSPSTSKPKPNPKPKQRPTSTMISFPRTNSYSSQSQSRCSKSNANMNSQMQNQNQNQNQRNRRSSFAATISSRFKTRNRTSSTLFNHLTLNRRPSTPTSNLDITIDNDMESQYSQAESESPTDSDWEFWDMSMTPDTECEHMRSWRWNEAISPGGTDIQLDPFSSSPSSKSFFVDFPAVKHTHTGTTTTTTENRGRRNSIFWPFSSFPAPPKTIINTNTNINTSSNKQQKRNSFLRNINITTPHPDSSFLHFPRPPLGRDQQRRGCSYEGVTKEKQAKPVNVHVGVGVHVGGGGNDDDNGGCSQSTRKPNPNSKPIPKLRQRQRPVTICGSLPLTIPSPPPLSTSSTASNNNATRIIGGTDGITATTRITETAATRTTRPSITASYSSSVIPVENGWKEGEGNFSESGNGDVNTVSIATNTNPRNVVIGIGADRESRPRMRMSMNDFTGSRSSLPETRTRTQTPIRKVVQTGTRTGTRTGSGASKLRLDLDLLDVEEAPASAGNSWNPNDDVDDVPSWMDWRLFHCQVLGAHDNGDL